MLLASAWALPILLLGIFYTFAGFVAAREAQKNAFLDAALADVSGGPRDRLDRERSLWLYALSAVVGAGGLLLPLAVPWRRRHFCSPLSCRRCISSCSLPFATTGRSR